MLRTIAGIAVASVAGWFLGDLLPTNGRGGGRPMTAADFGEVMLSSPAGSVAFGTFEEDFPEEYQEWAEAMSDAYNDGAGPAEIRALGREKMQEFVHDYADEIPLASTHDLSGLADAQALLMKKLSADDPRACAKLDFAGADSNTPLSGEAVMMAADITRWTIAAAESGANKPVAEESRRVRPADISALTQKLERSGASAKQIDALFAGRAISGSPEEQCRLLVVVQSAIAQMPDEQSARLTAALFAESEGNRS